jgi:small neutral amino acid transporter SnatA (MarC family)
LVRRRYRDLSVGDPAAVRFWHGLLLTNQPNADLARMTTLGAIIALAGNIHAALAVQFVLNGIGGFYESMAGAAR